MKEIQFVMMLACDSPQLFFISCMCSLYCGIIFNCYFIDGTIMIHSHSILAYCCKLT